MVMQKCRHCGHAQLSGGDKCNKCYKTKDSEYKPPTLLERSAPYLFWLVLLLSLYCLIANAPRI